MVWPICLAVIVVCTLYGCGTGNPLGRQAISGNVTLDGAPLDRGTIQFSPRRSSGGVGSGAVIDGGTYTLPAEKGLPPGEYLVRLFSAESVEAPVPAAPPTESDLPPGFRPTKTGKERIPARYNVQSDLFVIVTTDGPNRFDFDIQTK